MAPFQFGLGCRYDGPSKGSKKDQKLYREVDIERIAWRKYGGPFHFERLCVLLSSLEAIYNC
jgi:hypothetical protein